MNKFIKRENKNNLMNNNLVNIDDLNSLEITKAGISRLKQIGLFPFEIQNNEIYRHFIHLLGMRYGDGCIYYQKRNKSYTFYICFGKEEDAKKLIEDTKRIWGIKVNSYFWSNAFYVYFPADIARLMIVLGSPVGKKVKQIFKMPKWITGLPKNLRWEFLGGLFSCDGSCPRLQPSGTCSYSLRFSFNCEKDKVVEFKNGFMMNLKKLFLSLGVRCSEPRIVWKLPMISKDGTTTYSIQIRILTEKKNMIKFLEKIPYRYSKRYIQKQKEVLEAIRGDVLKKQIKIQLYQDSNFPELAVLLDNKFQRSLIENAANKFATERDFGKYKKLAEFLFENCNDFVHNLKSLCDAYIPHWKSGKRFIPISYLKLLVNLNNIEMKEVERHIQKARRFKSLNKFAIQVSD